MNFTLTSVLVLVALAASAIARPFDDDIIVGVTKQELLDRGNKIIDDAKKALETHQMNDQNRHIFREIQQVIILVSEILFEIPYHKSDDTLQMPDIILKEQAEKLKKLIDELDHPSTATTPTPTTSQKFEICVNDESNEEILKKAQELVDHAKKVAEQHKKNQKEFFEIEIIHEECAIIENLMKQIKNANNPQQLSLLKQNLTMHENILNNLVKKLENNSIEVVVYDESNEELLKKAQKLVDHAKKVIEQHKKNTNEQLEIEVIHEECLIIENLMKQIKDASNPQQLALLKQNLTMHEDILDKWVKSLEKKH